MLGHVLSETLGSMCENLVTLTVLPVCRGYNINTKWLCVLASITNIVTYTKLIPRVSRYVQNVFV